MENIFNSYNELLKTNPLVASFLPLLMAGLISFALRDVPTTIFQLIRREFTTSVILLSSGSGPATEQYMTMQTWFLKKGLGRWSRVFQLEALWTDTVPINITPGNGIHLFFYKGRPCWLRKEKIVQGGTTYQVTFEVQLTILGRNRELLNEMIREFMYSPKIDRGFLYHPSANGDWERGRRVAKRSINTVILNAGVKEEILERLDWFLENEAWYKERGLPYRLIILLSGPPGTGKTSLLRALASHYDRDLCPLNLASTPENKVGDLLRAAPQQAIIAMEDFDSCISVLKPEYRSEEAASAASFITGGKSSLLQALDGVDVLEGQVIFLTTNHLEKIDPALIRDERVNLIVDLGLLEDAAIRDYIRLFYQLSDDTPLPSYTFQPIAGATLQKLYIRNQGSYRDFIDAIPVTNPDPCPVSQLT